MKNKEVLDEFKLYCCPKCDGNLKQYSSGTIKNLYVCQVCKESYVYEIFTKINE